MKDTGEVVFIGERVKAVDTTGNFQATLNSWLLLVLSMCTISHLNHNSPATIKCLVVVNVLRQTFISGLS